MESLTWQRRLGRVLGILLLVVQERTTSTTALAHQIASKTAAPLAADVAPGLPLYAPPARPVLGALQIAGTGATMPLAEHWAAALQDRLPALHIQARSFGMTVTPPWWNLTDQRAVAVLSEQMTEREIAAFERQFGYQPTRLRVASNAVAVVVHRHNPMVDRRLTLAELDAIFSTTRRRGHTDVQRWGDLGLDGIWAQRPISPYSHDVSANLFVYFLQQVLQGGTFKASVVRQPGSAAVVSAVGRDLNAIGYTGISVVTPAVTVVPLAAGPERSAIAPTPDNILAQRYPLTLAVSLYMHWQPGSTLDAPLQELLRFIYSRQGQRIVANRGYVPLPAAVAAAELQQLASALNHPRP